MKHKSITLDKYFQLIKPQYRLIKIVPDKSIRNNKTNNIAIAISYMYKTLTKRIHKEQKKLFFETSFKISYIIDITKTDTSFYFMVPEVFLGILIEKIREVWPLATASVVSSIKAISESADVFQVSYKYQDALSINVNKANNEPLNSILNVLEIMQFEDRVTIIYNFIPHKFYNWSTEYKNILDNIKHNKSVLKNKNSSEYILKTALAGLNNIVTSFVKVIGDFLGSDKSNESLIDLLAITIEKHNEISNATRKKKDSILLQTQIAVISESLDPVRRFNNASTVCQSYQTLNEDNELIYSKANKINLESTTLKSIPLNTFSAEECSNLLQLPGRELMRRLGIKFSETSEVKLPEKLQHGYINLGIVKYRENNKNAYIEDEYNVGSLPLCLVGAQGSGKSTFMANYYRFASLRNEGGVVIDFIKNCELSQEIQRYLPKEKITVLDFTKEDQIQGFAFNELDINKCENTFRKLELANLQAQQIVSLVNAINPDQPLQARMNRYLGSAAQIVFSSGENSLKEVIRCLDNHTIRKSYIDKLQDDYREYLSEEIEDLKVLDEYSKPTKDCPNQVVIGTKEAKIEGILDRMSLLRGDFKLKYMFNKGGKDNINFVDALEDGKTIIIKMNQSNFKKHAKNVITTFLLSKIWMATEIRGSMHKQPKPCHISIDELFQTKTAMNMLAIDEIIPQTRKFGTKFIVSCQYTEQMDILIDTLNGAGASFMFLNGTGEKDFNKFKNKLTDFDFEDLKYMGQHSSLNLIYYSDGYASFITKLPKPI